MQIHRRSLYAESLLRIFPEPTVRLTGSVKGTVVLYTWMPIACFSCLRSCLRQSFEWNYHRVQKKLRFLQLSSVLFLFSCLSFAKVLAFVGYRLFASLFSLRRFTLLLLHPAFGRREVACLHSRSDLKHCWWIP